jgi:hypothetical protein
MNFEESVLKIAINKMFSESHFSICDLEDVGNIMGVNPKQHPNYRLLRALHCVKFRDMDKVVLDNLQEKVAECLRPSFSPGAMAKALMMEGNDHTPTEDTFLIN